MRVIIQSFNDTAGVREIGAMCNGAASVVVVEHGDAQHDFPTLTRPNVGRDYGAFIYQSGEYANGLVVTSVEINQ